MKASHASRYSSRACTFVGGKPLPLLRLSISNIGDFVQTSCEIAREGTRLKVDVLVI
jgi:hypothetical protein